MSNITIFSRLFERAAKDVLRSHNILREAELDVNITQLRTEIVEISDRWAPFLAWGKSTATYTFSHDRSQFISNLSFFIVNGVPHIRAVLGSMGVYYARLRAAYPNAMDDYDLIANGLSDLQAPVVTAAEKLESVMKLIAADFPLMSPLLLDSRDVDRALKSVDDNWFDVAAEISPTAILNDADDTWIDPRDDRTMNLVRPASGALQGNATAEQSSDTVVALAAFTAAAPLYRVQAAFNGYAYFKILIVDDAAGAIPAVVPSLGAELYQVQYSRADAVAPFESEMVVRLPLTVAGDITFTPTAGLTITGTITFLGIKMRAGLLTPYYTPAGAVMTGTVRNIDLVHSGLQNARNFLRGDAFKRMAKVSIAEDEVRRRHGATDVLRIRLRTWYRAHPLGSTDLTILDDGVAGDLVPYDPEFWVNTQPNVSAAAKQSLYRHFYQEMQDLANLAPINIRLREYYTTDLGI